MNQSKNTYSKSKEPQLKYRLGTIRIKILGGLNQFYGYQTSPSASVKSGLSGKRTMQYLMVDSGWSSLTRLKNKVGRPAIQEQGQKHPSTTTQNVGLDRINNGDAPENI